MRHVTSLGLLLLAVSLWATEVPVGVQLLHGAHRMMVVGEIPRVRVTGGPGTVVVEDAAASWRHVVELTADSPQVEFDGPATVGYHRLQVTGPKGQAVTDYGIVPVPWPGLRPESFFASNTSGIKRGEDADLLRVLGMRVQRAHVQPRVIDPPATPAGALAMDFTTLDAALAEVRSKNQWVLPVIGYGFETGKIRLRTPLAAELELHGPPRDAEEFIATWEVLLRRYPEFTTVEFWNEPWIYGWTWAGTPNDYRALQEAWLRRALQVSPTLRVIAGNSAMFVQDHIEQHPSCWRGLLHGTSHHPYSGAGDASMRMGRQRRSIDFGAQVTRDMGLPAYYLTEGGTSWSLPNDGSDPLWAETKGQNNATNAAKVVKFSVTSALGGAYQTNTQWKIGYGPGWTQSNTAYAVMTHLLEDRPVVAEVWPRHALITGAIFAGAARRDAAVAALPRSQELAVRWQVPVPQERQDDRTVVAVVWAETGPTADRLDTKGRIRLPAQEGLEARDLFGRAIPPQHGVFDLPLGPDPVWIIAQQHTIADLHRLIAQAPITGITATTVQVMPLRRSADQPQPLSIDLENHLNRDHPVDIAVACSGITTAPVKALLPPGERTRVVVPWPGSPTGITSPVTVTVSGPGGTIEHQQRLAVGAFRRATLPMDGSLNGLDAIEPVRFDSRWLSNQGDLGQQLLNPDQLPVTSSPKDPVSGRLWTAYDAVAVQVVVAVREPTFTTSAGTPVIKGRGKVKKALPYANADPAGLTHPMQAGDALLLGFGFRPRHAHLGRPIDDPWAWKGHFYDTDHLLVAHASAVGETLVRLWSPQGGRQTPYQTEPVAGVGPVAGASLVIRRHEERQETVYALRLPRTELPGFDPASGVCRFTMALGLDQSLGAAKTKVIELGEILGVPDHLYGFGSLSPSWESYRANTVEFGIDP